jgi:hypothetical protein
VGDPVSIPAYLIHLFDQIGVPVRLERLKNAEETPLGDPY